MKFIGPVKKFPGIQVVRYIAKRTLYPSQASYTEKILERLKMSDSNPVRTPMVLSDGYKIEEKDNELPSSTPYRFAIGIIMYLML